MRATFLLVMLVVFAACDQSGNNSGERMIETRSGPAIKRVHDPRQVALGESVYRQHCVDCHGINGEGDPGWRRRDAQGVFPPPPLNGSGHAWHHPRQWLREMIKHGSQPGQGRMPAWGDILSDEEIDAVIEWFQSRWPDQVYAAWYEMQQVR